MSEPVIRDPAVPAVAEVIAALRDVYSPNSSFPPDPPGNDVHFFAGEGPAPAAWDGFTSETGCEAPFLWVRVAARYRSKTLPEPIVGTEACSLPRTISVEVGVARCVSVEEFVSWDTYEDEAALSLEDSWRIETALCVAAARLRADNYTVAVDEILPMGPEGGAVGWSGTIYIQFA